LNTLGTCCIPTPGLAELNAVGGDETELTLNTINIYELLNKLE